MKLTRFYARNVLTFGDKGFEWNGIGPLNVIVGPNGSGKTNILRLLELVGNAFYLRDPQRPARILRIFPFSESRVEVGIELTPEEQRAVVELITASVRIGEPNWQANVKNVDYTEGDRVVRELLTLRSDTFSDVVPRRVTLCVQTRANLANPLDLFVELGDGRQKTVIDANGLRLGPYRRLSGWSGVEVKKALFEEFRKRYPKIAVQGPKVALATRVQLTKVAKSLGKTWLRQQLGQTTVSPRNLSLPALDFTQYEATQIDRTSDLVSLRTFLAAHGWRQNGVGLLDLLGLIYRSSMVRLPDIRSRPGDLLLASPQSDPDLQQVKVIDGSKLAPELFDLKNDPDPDRRALFSTLTEFFEQSTGLRVDAVQQLVSSQEGRQDRYASLHLSGPDFEIPLDFAAAGQVEQLAFLYALNSTRGSVLLLDEPALNLHPPLQRRLFSEMVSRARLLKNQLLVVTHSPSFVGTDQLDTVIRVCLDDNDRSSISRFASGSPRAVAQDRRWLQSHPELLSALFSAGVLLVEGGQEAAGLPIWFRACEGRDLLAERGIPVISVDGKGNFANFARVLDAWSIPHRVIGDGDARPETSAFGRRGTSYPQQDMVHLFRRYVRTEFDNAVRTIGNGPKDPAVAKQVASRTRPPPPVRTLWRWLRPFVIDPAK